MKSVNPAKFDALVCVEHHVHAEREGSEASLDQFYYRGSEKRDMPPHNRRLKGLSFTDSLYGMVSYGCWEI